MAGGLGPVSICAHPVSFGGKAWLGQRGSPVIGRTGIERMGPPRRSRASSRPARNTRSVCRTLRRTLRMCEGGFSWRRVEIDARDPMDPDRERDGRCAMGGGDWIAMGKAGVVKRLARVRASKLPGRGHGEKQTWANFCASAFNRETREMETTEMETEGLFTLVKGRTLVDRRTARFNVDH